MYYDTLVNLISAKIDESIQNLRIGLDPEVLAYWYKQIEYQSIEKAEDEWKEKIYFEQDKILWMKFHIHIPIYSIPTILEIIENNIPLMKYSTQLYFRKIQEVLLKHLYDSNVVNDNTKKNKKKSIKSKKQNTYNKKKKIK
jgi:glycerophosphoryl diester phosphodiesterase